ncbi:MAG: YihY/virulence factor BrkB family protein, partial [Chloroflexi bacterium]|nr:YihY/virulence factor BrkB family protein [Chloroflexota bacterium]
MSTLKTTVLDFVRKFGNDWCTNLASMLAYNFLGAILPLLLAILALAALVLPPAVVHDIGTSIAAALPAATTGASGLNIDFDTLLAAFQSSNASALTLLLSLAALVWTGSSLFGVMENCFSLIYRTTDRDFVRQKLMSLAMIAIFVVLTPLAFVASTISGSYQQLTAGLVDVGGL